MPEDSSSIYTIMAERVANAILGKINALIGSHNTNEQAHQDIREDIPSASSTVPNADTTTGSYGSGTSYARSNHTHPKSSLYAEASHNHTIANVTDLQTTLDSKVSIGDLDNNLQHIGAYTIHTVNYVSGSQSAFDISTGLLYTQQTPVFFLVKNNIYDNEANATLKYYRNGDNITILDAFSNTSASPIQQGVWKKDTWALFFCTGNSTVLLMCVFYDSVDINEIKNNISNILGIDILPYYVVSSVSKDKRVTYNVVDDFTIFDGNSFYLKVPYYETSTNVKVTLKYTTAFIMQGSNYVTESQVNGHLLKLRYDSGSFQVLEIYDNEKLIPLFSDLSSVATSGSYNDLTDKPTIPSASSTTPSADTTSGSVGTGTTWARSNHTHPKSSLYAKAGHTHSQYLTEHQSLANYVTTDDSRLSDARAPTSHNHTKSQITDFPAIPTKTSQLTNDSGFLTAHQSLSNYYNKSETNNYDVDFILGTQTASTSAWTGTTSVISSLRKGTTIFYKLPYASTSTSVTLNLTLKGGGTTGAKNVFYKNTTRLTTHFGVGQVVGLTYDGTAWYVISPSDNNSNNDNNYGGIQFKAGEALTTQTICCAKDNGQYYKVANGVVLDIRYPLIMTSSAVASGTTTNAMYRTWYGVNIANTKSMTLTNGSQLFLEGTAYSNGKFTISSNVVTHTLTNGRYYIKVGTALSTTQIRFISDMTVHYYNGTTLKPVIKKDQIVDFPTIPSKTSQITDSSAYNNLKTSSNATQSTINSAIDTAFGAIQETIGANSPQIMKVEYMETTYNNTNDRVLYVQLTCDVPITSGNIVAVSNDGVSGSISTPSGSSSTNVILCSFGIYDADASDTFNIVLKNSISETNDRVITDGYSFSHTFGNTNSNWVDTGYVNNSYSIRNEINSLGNEIDSLNNSITNLVQIQYIQVATSSTLSANGGTGQVTVTVTPLPSGYRYIFFMRKGANGIIYNDQLSGSTLTLTAQNLRTSAQKVYIRGYLIYVPTSWSYVERISS